MDKKLTLFNTTMPQDPTNPEGIHEYYLNIILNMPNNVYWLDKNCLTRGCNNNVLKLVGLRKPQDFIGLNYEKMGRIAHWTEGQAESFKHDDMEVIATGNPKFNVEEPPLYNEKGEPIYYISDRVPLFDKDKNVIGVVGISTNITQRKNMEEQLRVAKENAEALSKSKSEFIANMSHDVKTPIAGIIGLSTLLKQRLKGENAEFSQNILDCGQELMNFFNNCLEMAKSDQVDVVLNKEQFSLKALMNQIENLFRATIKNKNLTFRVVVDPKIPEILCGSREAIYRIVINLLGNAVKFTEKGSVTLEVGLGKKTREQNAIIKFSVKDTGVGIPSDKLKVIFDKFTRLTPSYEGNYTGTGLGLFVIDKLIKSLQGEIYVKSELGKGSQFTVALPLEIPLLDESEYEKHNFDSSHPLPIQFQQNFLEPSEILEKTPLDLNKAHYKILLVEDNQIAQQVSQTVLSALHCQIDIAECGNRAIEMFEPGKYDLVFMDMGLPDMTGDIVATRLREKEKGSSYVVPMLALTAHPVETAIANCKESNIQGMLSKPLSSLQALQIIHRYLHHQPIQVENLEEFNKICSKEISKENKPIKDLPDTEAELFQLEKYPLLDVERGLETAGNKGMLKEILEILVKKTLPEEIAYLQNYYATKDWDSIKKIAHKLKGGCFYCGTTKMLYACQYLEDCHKSGHSELLEKLYGQCMTVLDQTKKYIEGWL